MDEEQIKTRSSRISSHSDVHDEVGKVLEELIRKDDENGFESLIKCYRGNDGFRSIEKKFPSCHDIVMWICSHSALGCATALLEGKTGLAVDLNLPLRNGCFPLHLVAENLHSGLTYLFLRHGARTDLPCAKYSGMLPLSVALEALSRHKYLSDWNPSISIFKLIYCLCFPELQEPLETVKLLSEKTQELEKISVSVVQEGKLVELAGLLFVSWKKLLVPAHGDSIDSSAIGQCIMKSLASLINQEYKIVNTCKNIALSECRRMQERMASAWLMLAIFERGGEIFDIFRPLCLDPKNHPHKYILNGHPPNFVLVRSTIVILKRLGFALKREDIDLSDMQCFRIGLKSRHKEKLRSTIDRMLISRQRQTQITSPASDGSRKQKELISNKNVIVQSPSFRAFHTCRILRSLSVPELCAHHRMNRTSSKQPNVLSARRGAYDGLTLLVGIKGKMRLLSKLV